MFSHNSTTMLKFLNCKPDSRSRKPVTFGKFTFGRNQITWLIFMINFLDQNIYELVI